MSVPGHGAKNSRRAYLVCIASITGIPKCCRAALDRAIPGPYDPVKRGSMVRANLLACDRLSHEGWPAEADGLSGGIGRLGRAAR